MVEISFGVFLFALIGLVQDLVSMEIIQSWMLFVQAKCNNRSPNIVTDLSIKITIKEI